MAIIPVLFERPNPPDLQAVLDSIPSSFLDDGLSSFPDSLLGWSIRSAGRAHDFLFCSRCHPAGTMDNEWRENADWRIGQWVKAKLPFGLRLIGYAVFAGVYVGAGHAFDSCGKNPKNANAGQLAAGLCRHNINKPDWMK